MNNKLPSKTLKTNTSAEYIRRIEQALAFIQSNLDEAIQLEAVAAASCFSPYHFHRIFQAIVSETVNEYVSRKRMERAVGRLLCEQEMSITDVALAGGFSSSANFSKAFKLYFGISPSELRNAGSSLDFNDSKIGKIYRKYGKAFNPKNLYSQFVTNDFVFEPNELEEILMKVKVEDQQEKSIAYLSSAKGYEINSVYETWDKLLQWGNSLGLNAEEQTKLAICHDNPSITPEEKCRYDAAIVVEKDVTIPQPFTQSTIPGGKYAVAYYKDTAEKINNFMTELCAHWFPTSGFEPDNFPPIFNYLNDSRKEGFVEMNVYIKVKELGIS